LIYATDSRPNPYALWNFAAISEFPICRIAWPFEGKFSDATSVLRHEMPVVEHYGAKMLKGFIAGIVLTIAAALIGGYLVLQSGLVPANADTKPGPVETWAANTSLDATLNREAPKDPNPVATTDANLIDGINLYGQHCAICHGTAKGTASASPVAKGLNPSPPQMATDGVEDDPEGVSFWKIKHGIRWTGMPAWKDTLNDQQIWTLALFLKHMDKLPAAAQEAWQKVKN
jgi:thiosulfate dehydrogenase